ncbi:MAG: TldD/PmbA family protein [Candidatus Nezhaarchaeota archaeon]|nr:TldD/PmbA family protein [Candidatus Nezhaarchaeota archaeon]
MRVGRIIDLCINRGVEYADCTSITYRRLRVDYINGQAVVSQSSGDVYVLKVLSKGSWGVGAFTKLSDEVITDVLKKAAANTVKNIKLAQRRPAQGGYVIGQKKEISESCVPDVVHFLKSVETSLREYCESLQSFEGVVEGLVKKRAMISSDGVNAYEVKPLVVGCFIARAKSGEVATTEVFGSGGLEVLERVSPQELVEELAYKLNATLNSKALNPYYRGSRFEVVLSPKAASHVMQVIVEEFLNARRWRWHLKDGYSNLTILDDPTIEGGYGSFFFDDEGVKARRKKLIEDGRLVSLLHNRETAYVHGVEPTGNGRGFAVPPEPLHSNIIVCPGDWSLKEIVEETKLGFLVHGVKRVYLVNELLAIEPDATFLLIKGELRSPVKVNYFAIDARSFFSEIKAISSGPLGFAREVMLGCETASYSPPIKVNLRAF